MRKEHSTPPRRAIILVLDSVGIGAMPDAHLYGDEGSDTLGNLSRAFPDGLILPNLGRLGLGNIAPIRGVAPDPEAIGGWGKCAEQSRAKDTTLGHWEIGGIISTEPFPTFPEGFPPEVIAPFEAAIGCGTLGNYAASGTDIMRDLGEEHVRSGKPIVYTSADSVFQIAAHEEAFGLDRLYEICEIARRQLDGPFRVGRVIARPFIGPVGAFTRTRNRRDYSVPPPGRTILDLVKGQGLDAIGIGKIGDIFAHQGLTREIHAKGNDDCMRATIEEIRKPGSGLIFTNLVDTDMLFGHRNDCKGYRMALERIDGQLPELLDAMRGGDLLFITADHGCDPTTPSTDHSREYVPLLVWARWMSRGANLGTRPTFADIGATIADYLGIDPTCSGEGLMKKLAGEV